MNPALAELTPKQQDIVRWWYGSLLSLSHQQIVDAKLVVSHPEVLQYWRRFNNDQVKQIADWIRLDCGDAAAAMMNRYHWPDWKAGPGLFTDPEFKAYYNTLDEKSITFLLRWLAYRCDTVADALAVMDCQHLQNNVTASWDTLNDITVNLFRDHPGVAKCSRVVLTKWLRDRMTEQQMLELVATIPKPAVSYTHSQWLRFFERWDALADVDMPFEWKIKLCSNWRQLTSIDDN